VPKAKQLKVFRTPAGFYDAYVAAPSQKAAIEAWGADKHVFARGGAEVITDPELTAEPLANPGVVIKRKRGSYEEQLAALGPARPRQSRTAEPVRAEAAKPAQTKPVKLKPRPNRGALDEADQQLQAFEDQAAAELAEIRSREAELARERQRLETAQASQRERLGRKLAAQRTRYEAAMDKWRRESG
jgi:hypothetical protein